MRSTFEILFPVLKPGGTYVVEDLHCCFWKNTGRPEFTEYLKGLIGPMMNYGRTGRKGEEVFYDDTYPKPSELEGMIASIELYKDIVFIGKKK
jgi:hypothetical protein